MTESKPKSMVVAGVMSGTSADGVDVALCRVSPSRVKGGTPSVKLLGHVGVAYPKGVRAAVLGAMDAQAISVAELARLELAAGRGLCGCGGEGAEEVWGAGGPGGMSWADGLSPGIDECLPGDAGANLHGRWERLR